MPLPPFQSLLFVPGSRPERFEKALASGADLVCVDLEDAVGPADKESARAATLAAMGNARLGLRINGLRTRHGLADLLAVGAVETKPPFVMVPMVESAVELEIVHAQLGPDIPLLPLIETVVGIAQANAIAHAPGVAGIMLGGADFAGQLGVTLNWDALYAARAAIVMACADARIPRGRCALAGARRFRRTGGGSDARESDGLCWPGVGPSQTCCDAAWRDAPERG